MDRNLLAQGTVKLVAGLLLMGLLLFLPAGTLRYWNAWLLLAVLFVPMLLLGAVLLVKAPDLLRKRLNHRERETEQRKVVALSGLMFLAGFVAAGLDFRYGWSCVPEWLTVTAAALFLLGYGLYAEVMRENAWLSRTVEVQEGQRVIDTGLYGMVRHPMYAASILMFLAMPVVLGSVVSLVIFLSYPVVIVFRIRNEEQVLEEGLPGYMDYQRKVRYRLIPFVW